MENYLIKIICVSREGNYDGRKERSGQSRACGTFRWEHERNFRVLVTHYVGKVIIGEH